MKEINDSIYDAYYYKHGKKFGNEVRERIHWISKEAKGNHILDIGCSQGISSIILAREGKKVLGIDVSSTAIREAKRNLDKEEESTKSLIKFEQENFMIREFNDTYDVVILGEVLEHITDVETFFSKAASLINENGKLIITTPFGINDYIDHKNTFYVTDFLNLQSETYKITKLHFFGKWIGVIFEKNPKNAIYISEEMLKNIELQFMSIERALIDKYLDKIGELNDKNEMIKELKKKLKDHDNSDHNFKQMYLDQKRTNIELNNQLITEYDKQEKLLREYKEMSTEYHQVNKRYNSLKNSKLGKLTIKYWEKKRKNRGL